MPLSVTRMACAGKGRGNVFPLVKVRACARGMNVDKCVHLLTYHIRKRIFLFAPDSEGICTYTLYAFCHVRLLPRMHAHPCDNDICTYVYIMSDVYKSHMPL